MRTRLPIFALAILAAAAVGWAAANRGSNMSDRATDAEEPTRYTATAKRTSDEPAGEVVVPNINALLNQAVAQLSAAGSIEAKVRQRIDLFDRELIGSGTYAQQGAGITTRSRLEMRMRASETATELLQICNGETLWTFNAADGLRTLRRVDIDRVQDALRGDSPESAFIAPPRGTIGLGGLPWMLEGLRHFCDFTAVRTAKLGDLDVYVVDGAWRTERLLPLLPDEERKRVAAGGRIDVVRLPEHLPDRVSLYLGRDDLFPYRFDYSRTIASDKDTRKAADNKSAQSAPAAKPILTLEIYEVRFGRNLPLEMFNYKPGQSATDDTERYIQRLKGTKEGT